LTEFTPISGTIGGLLIGSAVGLLLLANHRVAGISGILGNALWPSAGEQRDWRLSFLVALPLGALAASAVTGPMVVDIETSSPLLIAAGLLVGFGTRLGNGCTSGHGVCGMSRGSPRSIAATLTFIAVGALTVFITRHLLGGT